MVKTGIITVSDKGSQGRREDKAGPVIKEIITEKGWEVTASTIIPDEQKIIEEKLIEYADELGVDVIFTTGGTGFAVRDVTPEATMAVIHRTAPGIAEAMRLESLKVTPMAMLSRATAGIRGRTIIINLPGSPKAVRECLGVVLSALGHGVEILQGVAGECAENLHHQSHR